jgi:hypothetical protein
MPVLETDDYHPRSRCSASAACLRSLLLLLLLLRHLRPSIIWQQHRYCYRPTGTAAVAAGNDGFELELLVVLG